MDERLLAAIQRELADGYGMYSLTASEALLVYLPRLTHGSAWAFGLRNGGLRYLLDVTRADRYGRVWLDDAGVVNVEHRSDRY